MHAALGHYYSGEAPTRAALDEMEQAKHWHKDFMWYGPAGIGTTRGLARLTKIIIRYRSWSPSPIVAGRRRGILSASAMAYYAVTGGWGYLRATHTGGELFGVGADGETRQDAGDGLLSLR